MHVVLILMIDVSRLSISFIMYSKKRSRSSSSTSSSSSSMFRSIPNVIAVNTPLYQYKQYETTIDNVSNKIPSLINTIQYVPKKRFKVRCTKLLPPLPLLQPQLLLQQPLLPTTTTNYSPYYCTATTNYYYCYYTTTTTTSTTTTITII